MGQHNKKGSPKKLGRPVDGEVRNPTSGECESCHLRRHDLICSQPSTGKLSIMRCQGTGKATQWVRMDEEEAAPLIVELERFWDQ